MAKKETFVWMAVAAIFFLPFIGNVHLFDWDEINFAEIAREMLISGNYAEPQINFQPFLEKPPLFFWLQSLSMSIFGVSEFAARLPNAILGILQLPLLFLLGKKLRNAAFGRLWALVYFGTVLPHLYFKSGIIDPWFNFFIFSAICLIYFALETGTGERSRSVYSFAGGLMAGLAVLTKGPVALLIVGLSYMIFALREKSRISAYLLPLLGLIAGILLSFGSWLLVDFVQHGPAFLQAFTQRQWELLTTEDAGHGGFFLYHFVVLLFGCFPASSFMIAAIGFRATDQDSVSPFTRLMKILFWVVLILFSLVQTKIVHYSSLCYFPLSFLAALYIQERIEQGAALKKCMRVLLGVTAFPFVLAPLLMGWLSSNMDVLKSLLSKDAFALENLEAKIHWSGWEFLPGVLLLGLMAYFFYTQKKGSIQQSYLALFFGTALYLQLVLIFFIGRIEGISQHANIEFWQSKSSEDCYLLPYGYKSYTPYFYGQVKPASTYVHADSLLNSQNLSKNLYLSCKVTKRKDLEQRFPDAQFLYNKNGFYFYLRRAAAGE